MAADAWKRFNSTVEWIGDNTIDLDAGNAYFKVVLVTSAWTPSATHDAYSDISTHEVSNGNGYTTGGAALTGVTWATSSGISSLDSNDPTWTASGGSITARYAVLVHVAAGTGNPVAGDKIVCYSLLDNAPADVTALDGAPLTIQLSANGYFRFTGGT